LARAYTGKDLIIKGEYHGWHDWCMAASERNAGIPGDLKNSVVYCEYNDIDSFEKVVKDNDVAAIILEPTQLEAPRDGFLSKLRMLCDDNGVLLIFDEIVTGFRFSIGGAQEYFDVIPDLACFGKGIANGMPLSAVVGRSNIFDKVSDSIFMSTTFGGETLSLAACKANIQYMLDNNVCSYLWDIGAKIKDGFNIYCQDNDIPLECVGYPCRLLFISKLDDKELDVNIRSLFLQECVKGGVLMAWQVLPMFAHCNNDILYSINVFKDAASICAEAYINNNIGGLLQGKPVNWVEVL
jgi:glutamate-1-semialdehyde aminotransferase